jgi:hypothetical protein
VTVSATAVIDSRVLDVNATASGQTELTGFVPTA